PQRSPESPVPPERDGTRLLLLPLTEFSDDPRRCAAQGQVVLPPRLPVPGHRGPAGAALACCGGHCRRGTARPRKSGASASPGLQQRNFNGQARTSPLGLSGTRLRTGKERKQGNRSPRVGVIRNRGDLLLSPSSAGERG